MSNLHTNQISTIIHSIVCILSFNKVAEDKFQSKVLEHGRDLLVQNGMVEADR